MKINVVYWLLLSISVILFGCSNDEEINRDFTFIGTVIDASSKEPMPELPVVVTDGNNIHTSAKTNADGTDTLFNIPGNVPNPVNMPTYCYFKERCSRCTKKCSGNYPEMVQVSPTHFVACHLYSEGQNEEKEETANG